MAQSAPSDWLRDAALRYAERGWAVLPLHSPAGGSCSCGRSDCGGKHPRTAHGLNEASTDPVVIAGWWRRWPKANIGIRTGSASGLVVLDVDPAHGGARTLSELGRGGNHLKTTARVLTGGGGWHAYYAHPGGDVPNDAGRRLGAGLDVRGDGGYVVAPPSRHPSGIPYRWYMRMQREVAPLPEWLAERLIQASPAPRAPIPLRAHDPHISLYADSALLGETQAVHAAPDHERNHSLNRAAFNLGQLVGAGLLDEERVTNSLRSVALTAGLGQRETDSTIASGLRAGRSNPRSIAHLAGGSSTRMAIARLTDNCAARTLTTSTDDTILTPEYGAPSAERSL